MPFLERPDGARIHYEIRGEGPPVVLVLGDHALEDLRSFGDRLVVPWYAGDSWQEGSIPRAQELLPEARVVELENGSITRPELAAEIVREMTA